jgi:ribonucleoside-diphosphate reductase alpha chain
MELNLSKNAITILEKRYLDPGETPYDRYLSMATKMASIEDETDKTYWTNMFMKMFAEQKILPNSPAIMNYGKEHRQQQGSACFVLPIKDDLNDIFDTIRRSALIHKSGGGTGYNFSSLRPNGAIVKTTGKPSSGVIPFLKAYDAATGAVSQGGTRRGANMGILNCWHPDIIEFIKCKADTTQINNFNLSVGVTEEFFKAVETNSDWELYFLGDDSQRMLFYPNGDESQAPVTELKVKARELYDMIIEFAHRNGEPGILFVDRLQAGNSVPSKVINATNPCGEQPLPPNNSCVLASINLANHMIDDTAIDWIALDETIKNGVRLLDNVVSLNEYPVQEIKIEHDSQRRIGLGLTGLGDVLINMGVSYGSIEGRKTAGRIMKFINDRSHYWSFQLGKERGNFELFDESIFNLKGKYKVKAQEFYKSILSEDEYKDLIESKTKGYMRNAATTTIAPTGSLTSLLGCECYGCEPMFAPGYLRFVLNGEKLVYISALVEKIAKREGFYSKELMEKMAEKGSALVDGVPQKWQEVLRGANEISVDDHIQMQAELQKYCDSGISKTINMAAEATIEDVKKAYDDAFKSGVIKGITVYRDGARSGAPIAIGTKEEKQDEEVVEETKPVSIDLVACQRPKRTEGGTTSYNTGCGKVYLIVNHDDKSIIETFAFTGSGGGCQGLTEGLSRMASLTIRLARAFAEQLNLDTDQVIDSTIMEIIDQLKSVRCNVSLRNKKSEGKSCPDIMGKALEKEYALFKREQQLMQENYEEEFADEAESDCEAEYGGCSSCPNYSACSGETNGEIEVTEKKITIKAPKIVVNAPEVKIEPKKEKEDGDFITCPDCGFKMERSEGCMICRGCGYSKCN